MKRKTVLILFSLALLSAGCAVMQSAVKSTFPYTTTLVIPKSSQVGVELSASGTATSFDQSVSKDGNPGDKIKQVRIVSAKLQSKDPSDFNIGNLVSAKIYMSKTDGSEETLVASRTDITPDVGNSIVLDIDNSNLLDKIIREPKVKIRMVYKLHNHIYVTANLRLVLGLSANPK
ncbi:MAG: hypothetical protein JWQ63_477 [Mucilaginibacter sp.]|jgi:hypothetical protein|nr:hypothetical protein [Mucilaginibacter sp.]